MRSCWYYLKGRNLARLQKRQGSWSLLAVELLKNLLLALFLGLPWVVVLAAQTPTSAQAVSGTQGGDQQTLAQVRAMQQNLQAPSSAATQTNKTSEPVTTSNDPRKVLPESLGGSSQVPKQQYKAATEDINKTAFASMAANLMPLSPDEVHTLHQMFDASKAAAAAPSGTPPRPTTTTQLVNLAPGATSPVLRLAQGFVSTVIFLDSSSAPWPIKDYSLGNPDAFNIQWNQKDNTMMIQANKLYTYGNLVVRLVNLETPIVITLIPGQQAVDYRVDMRVPGLGPKAKSMGASGNLPNTIDAELLHVLDGAAPTGGRSLNIEGGRAMAWQMADVMYIRTRYTLLSPSWISTLSSADGTHVYKMPVTPLILVSAHGKVIKLKVKGL